MPEDSEAIIPRENTRPKQQRRKRADSPEPGSKRLTGRKDPKKASLTTIPKLSFMELQEIDRSYDIPRCTKSVRMQSPQNRVYHIYQNFSPQRLGVEPMLESIHESRTLERRPSLKTRYAKK